METKWIDVADKLPEAPHHELAFDDSCEWHVSDKVLIHMIDVDELVVAVYIPDDPTLKACWVNIYNGDTIYCDNVDYWMSIPNVPAE